MSVTGAIGYIDQNGNYRGTAVFEDAEPEGNVGRVLPMMLNDMCSDCFIEWVEDGIVGGGYDGLYNDVTLKSLGRSNGPYLIDAENYDSSSLDFIYVVDIANNDRVSFFDPKNVMGYDDEWLNYPTNGLTA